eukprot:458331_1
MQANRRRSCKMGFGRYVRSKEMLCEQGECVADSCCPSVQPTLTICDEDFCTLFCGTGYRRSGSNDPDHRFVGASCERIDGQMNWKFLATCIKTNIVIPKTLKFDSQGKFEDMFSEVFDGFAQKAKSADRDDEYDALD